MNLIGRMRKICGLLILLLSSCARQFDDNTDFLTRSIVAYDVFRLIDIPRFAYAPLSGGNIGGFSVNRVTGQITLVGTYSTGISPSALVTDTQGKFAYATGGTTLYAASIDQTTGALVSAGTQATGAAPSAPRMDPYNRFVYLISGAGSVTGYAINQTSGATTLIGSWPSAVGYGKPLVHTSGRYLYANTGSGIYMYSIDQTSGALTSLGSISD
ncbi:MAG TPA: beta-propeller fold lactonase family protein, partial [Leptospiraceae bacterium]|nr:beta-propeller fold lactonase family protein [Leptospiraceae bacterium]